MGGVVETIALIAIIISLLALFSFPLWKDKDNKDNVR